MLPTLHIVSILLQAFTTFGMLENNDKRYSLKKYFCLQKHDCFPVVIIKKIKRRKVYARFKDKIWAADLAEMESLSSKNKNVKFL